MIFNKDRDQFQMNSFATNIISFTANLSGLFQKDPLLTVGWSKKIFEREKNY